MRALKGGLVGEVDEGAGAGAVAVLEGGDDGAVRREGAEVVGVVGAGGGHAVGEDDDGELGAAAAGEEGDVGGGGDGDGPGGEPEEECEERAGEEVVGAGEARVSPGREADGPRDPGERRGGGRGGGGGRVVEC